MLRIRVKVKAKLKSRWKDPLPLQEERIHYEDQLRIVSLTRLKMFELRLLQARFYCINNTKP